jgi:ElaB/YqjD/DUF883 family membrane-anchored ribosome-binding protein
VTARAVVSTVAFLVLATLLPSVAQAATTTRTINATVVYENKPNPNDVGNCGAVAFAQWPADEIKGAVAWRVIYTRAGNEESRTTEPPFHNTYVYTEATYTAPPGTNRYAIGTTARDGAGFSDCSEYLENMRKAFGTAARVEVTVDTTACDKARSDQQRARKALRDARARLRRAKSDAAKRRARAAVRRATTRERAASAAVRRDC